MKETEKEKKGAVARRGLELHDAAVKDLPLLREELAAVMCCGEETVSRWVKLGMPCFFLGEVQRVAYGAKPRFRYRECLAWLERRSNNMRTERSYNRRVAV